VKPSFSPFEPGGGSFGGGGSSGDWGPNQIPPLGPEPPSGGGFTPTPDPPPSANRFIEVMVRRSVRDLDTGVVISTEDIRVKVAIASGQFSGASEWTEEFIPQNNQRIVVGIAPDPIDPTELTPTAPTWEYVGGGGIGNTPASSSGGSLNPADSPGSQGGGGDFSPFEPGGGAFGGGGSSGRW
jgi:uncharacterized membrane protein YgcG